ncbi:hypothetical protein [Streptomyces sp. NBC_00091]|uniref:hypothetical protein n=1 Tax=Streptomyces sp. NBC_00091 TaxID=2975648 RepID=UPI002258F752|nr:hypothetical protein [Streptomyces sp. NBC_00091]MCX5379343.1 hypothetical protein [Streptomyces sp. NBC_00091]
MMKRHTRLAIPTALFAAAVPLGTAPPPATASSGVLPTASCTAAVNPANPAQLILTVSGFSGDLKVTETGGKYKMIIHKGTPTITVPQGTYTVQWANAPTPAENQLTACTTTADARTQAQDQYQLGYRQGLSDGLSHCMKLNPQDDKDPNYRKGYDAGVALALVSERCKAP